MCLNSIKLELQCHYSKQNVIGKSETKGTRVKCVKVKWCNVFSFHCYSLLECMHYSLVISNSLLMTGKDAHKARNPCTRLLQW